MFGNKTNQTSAGIFDKIGSAETSESGVYPLPGVYPCLFVDVLKVIESRKGDVLFIAEFDIVESDVPERPQGTRMSWIVNFRHDAAPGNVRAFLAKLMNVSVDEVGPKESEMACSDENPCHGRLIRLEASNTTTKAGNDFTLCKWQSIPDELQVKANEMRQNAGFGPF